MAYKKSRNLKKKSFRRKSRKAIKGQKGRGNVSGKNTPVPEEEYDIERANIPIQRQLRSNLPASIMTSSSIDDYDIESATHTPIASIKTRQFSPLPYGSRPNTPFQISDPIIKTTPTRGEKIHDNSTEGEFVLDINKIKLAELANSAKEYKLKKLEEEDWNEADKKMEEETKNTIEKLRKRVWGIKENEEYRKRKSMWDERTRMEDLVRQEAEEAKRAMYRDLDKKEVQLESREEAYQEDIKNRIKRHNKWFTPIFEKDRKNKGGKRTRKRKTK